MVKSKKRSKSWRLIIRSLHRDIGYLAVGLTIIYALSGIAINHIDDWNANFVVYEATHTLDVSMESTDEQIIAQLQQKFEITETPKDSYRASPEQFDVEFNERIFRVALNEGMIYEESESPRFFFRVANWLHYNRGKAAWTYIADGYAIFLLFLATSGLVMIKGKKGVWGRGIWFVLLGIAVPILYVQFSGGPS